MTDQAVALARGAGAPEEIARAGRPAGIAGRIAAIGGWRRLGLAWVTGALGALAMPPFGFLPALVLSITVAVWLTDGAVAGRRPAGRVGRSFLVGWAWGFGYLTAGLWWLGSAFLVEADEFLWALPLGVIGLPFALGLFYGAGFSVAGLLWRPGPSRIAALASASPEPNGCAGTCSPGSPGTCWAWRWGRTCGSCRPPPSSACTG